MTIGIPPLTSGEVARIAAIAGRLSSDHDGEALSAARLFVRAISKHGLRPEELIAGALAPKPVTSGFSPQPWPVSPRRNHQRQAADRLACGPVGGLWSKKEGAFLRDMLLSSRSPTPAQLEWLTALVRKARAAGGAQ